VAVLLGCPALDGELSPPQGGCFWSLSVGRKGSTEPLHIYPHQEWSLFVRTDFRARGNLAGIGRNRTGLYTVYDRIFGDFPAKNTVYTPYTFIVLANPKDGAYHGT